MNSQRLAWPEFQSHGRGLQPLKWNFDLCLIQNDINEQLTKYLFGDYLNFISYIINIIKWEVKNKELILSLFTNYCDKRYFA